MTAQIRYKSLCFRRDRERHKFSCFVCDSGIFVYKADGDRTGILGVSWMLAVDLHNQHARLKDIRVGPYANRSFSCTHPMQALLGFRLGYQNPLKAAGRVDALCWGHITSEKSRLALRRLPE